MKHNPVVLYADRINDWHVHVVRYGATTPVVTAVRWEPYAIEQVCLPGASRATVRSWLEGLQG